MNCIFYTITFVFTICLTFSLSTTAQCLHDPKFGDSIEGKILTDSVCPNGVGEVHSIRGVPSNLLNVINATNLPCQPPKVVQLVFHVFQKEGSNPETFDNSHLEYIKGLVHHPTMGLNYLYSNMCNPEEYLKDTRIRFKLNDSDIFFWQNDDAWDNGHIFCTPGSAGWHTQRSLDLFLEYAVGTTGQNNLTSLQQDALHVLFIEGCERASGDVQIHHAGYSNGIGSLDHQNFVILTGAFDEYIMDNMVMTSRRSYRLAHELGHLMGAFHDGAATAIMNPQGVFRCEFDEKDIKTFQFHLEGNQISSTRFSTIINAVCPPGSEIDAPPVVISSGENITWDSDLKINSDMIVIEDGGILNIDGCTVTLPKNAIVQVQEGGLLNITNATITSECGVRWEHIEVNGNPSLSQTTTNQGRLVLSNSTLENAKTGVLLDSEFNNGNMGGGILEAMGSTFLNCKRGVSFITYFNNNISFIDNCDFIIDNDFITPNNQAGQITMWQVTGVEIDNSNFDFSGPPAENQNGIHSAGSSFSASLNTFRGFINGVYGNRAAKTSLITLDGNNFYNNSIAMNMINGQNLNADCNRVFIGNSMGLFANTSSTINAPGNFWGSSSGPSHHGNPSGTGVPIVSSVSTSAYTPWLTGPFCKGKGSKNLNNSSITSKDIKIYSPDMSLSAFIESDLSPIKRVRIFTIDGRPLLDESFSGTSEKVEISFPNRLLSGIYIFLSETESGFQSNKVFVR